MIPTAPATANSETTPSRPTARSCNTTTTSPVVAQAAPPQQPPAYESSAPAYDTVPADTNEGCAQNKDTLTPILLRHFETIHNTGCAYKKQKEMSCDAQVIRNFHLHTYDAFRADVKARIPSTTKTTMARDDQHYLSMEFRAYCKCPVENTVKWVYLRKANWADVVEFLLRQDPVTKFEVDYWYGYHSYACPDADKSCGPGCEIM